MKPGCRPFFGGLNLFSVGVLALTLLSAAALYSAEGHEQVLASLDLDDAAALGRGAFAVELDEDDADDAASAPRRGIGGKGYGFPLGGEGGEAEVAQAIGADQRPERQADAGEVPQGRHADHHPQPAHRDGGRQRRGRRRVGGQRDAIGLGRLGGCGGRARPRLDRPLARRLAAARRRLGPRRRRRARVPRRR